METFMMRRRDAEMRTKEVLLELTRSVNQCGPVQACVWPSPVKILLNKIPQYAEFDGTSGCFVSHFERKTLQHNITDYQPLHS
jgi:hypothetical protein